MRKLHKIMVATLAPAAALAGMVAVPSSASAAGYTSSPSIYSFTSNMTDFYPTVRDGYRDGVRFTADADVIYGENADTDDAVPQTWTVVVRNSSGTKMASYSETDADNWNDAGGSWLWNGRNLAGAPVRTGTYKATLTVRNDDTRETDTATRTVYAKTSTTYPRATVSRDGIASTHRARTSSCYIDGYTYSRELDLDCWGGSYALADYGFAVPRNATNLTWSTSGERGCCTNGRLIRNGVRTSATHYNVRVKVTNWASYTVRRVSVTYTHKVVR